MVASLLHAYKYLCVHTINNTLDSFLKTLLADYIVHYMYLLRHFWKTAFRLIYLGVGGFHSPTLVISTVCVSVCWFWRVSEQLSMLSTERRGLKPNLCISVIFFVMLVVSEDLMNESRLVLEGLCTVAAYDILTQTNSMTFNSPQVTLSRISGFAETFSSTAPHAF